MVKQAVAGEAIEEDASGVNESETDVVSSDDVEVINEETAITGIEVEVFTKNH